MKATDELTRQLDSFNTDDRQQALQDLLKAASASLPETGGNVNMHCHSFFSYNADSWSPSHIAWAARAAGLYGVGLCDFDVLDGLDEFLTATRTVGVRATVDLETRAYVKALADVDISSPGEPGVSYVMGAGFVSLPAVGSPQAATLEGYRRNARERNEALIERINPHVPDIALDYEADVLPLTPAGVATERHIIQAYADKAAKQFPGETTLAEYWARLLETDYESALELIADRAALEEKVRARLAKRGGIGYQQPSVDAFPPIEDFMAWVASCNAVPMATWLDGTSDGEADPEALMGVMRDAGAISVNIIPDRNWNVVDPDVAAVKIGNLNAAVDVANALHMPVNIGTELNKAGLPFVDDLSVDALRPHQRTFLRGARIMVAHTNLLRFANMPYGGERAAAAAPDIAERNDMFERVGAMAPLTAENEADLKQIGPEKAFNWFMDHRETL